MAGVLNLFTSCLVLQVIAHMVVNAGLDLASDDTVILVADWGNPGRILNVSLRFMNFTTVPTELTSRPVAVDYDSERETVYWTDVLQHQIRYTNIKTGEDKVLAQLPEASTPDGLALDVGEKLLFFTDAARNMVVKLSVLTQSSETIVRKHLHAPRAIVTYPKKRKIFWTDWGTVPRIETANYDGSGRTPLVSTELTWPNGLTIDTYNDRLYWCDAKKSRIESVYMNGLDRRLVLSDPGSHFFDIFYHRGLLYFTDWARQQSLFHIPVCGGKKGYLKSGGFRHLAGLHVVSASKSEKQYIVPDCADQCSRCRDVSTCDPLTGRCGAGCVEGWTGTRCNTVAYQLTTERQSLITTEATTSVPTRTSQGTDDTETEGVYFTTGTVAAPTPVTDANKKTSGVDHVTAERTTLITNEAATLVTGREFQDIHEALDVSYVTANITDVGPAVAAVDGSQNSNNITFGLAAYVALGVVSFLLLLATVTLIVIYIRRQRKAKDVYNNLADVRPQSFNNNTYTLMSGDSDVYLVPVEESPKQDADHYYEDICELKSFTGRA